MLVTIAAAADLPKQKIARLTKRARKLLGHDAPAPGDLIAAAKPASQYCGVYFLIEDGKIVYVGQSTNVLVRVREHAIGRPDLLYSFIPCARENLDELESIYIHLLQPPKNGRHGNAKIFAPLALCDL